MKSVSTLAGVALAALVSATFMGAAGAQTGPAGFCEFSVDANHGGDGTYIAGGNLLLFYNPGAGPSSVSGYENLSVSHDPSYQDRLSSVRVGPGCTAGWAVGSGSDWGVAETSADVGQFLPSTDNQADAAFCFCR